MSSKIRKLETDLPVLLPVGLVDQIVRASIVRKEIKLAIAI